MDVGYSKTALGKKLGIKEGFTIILHNPPGNYFNLFADFPERVVLLEKFKDGAADFIHVFCTRLDELESVLTDCTIALKKNGALWVSWPKGASKLPSDLNRDLIREHVLKTGLVDIKVAAIDPIWSGLKFVHRLKNR
jgi:hypothetical protein